MCFIPDCKKYCKKMTSLNENLLQGPDLTNSISGVLMLFRQAPVALIADIEAMFHQVRVCEHDMDVLRFLWWLRCNIHEEPKEYCMNVHQFGATSSPSCAAFSLKRTANDNIDKFGREMWARFRNRLRRRFYARRGQSIDPSTIVNETGTRDMVITKNAYRTNKVLPDTLAAPTIIEQECHEDVGGAPTTGINDGFETLVQEYVSGVIAKAADTLLMEKQALLGNRNVIIDRSADDISLSSSIISQIADTAVTDSLSNVFSETNMNQSAIHKTIKDFLVQTSLELLAKKLTTDNLLLDYNC